MKFFGINISIFLKNQKWPTDINGKLILHILSIYKCLIEAYLSLVHKKRQVNVWSESSHLCMRRISLRCSKSKSSMQEVKMTSSDNISEL